MVFIGGATIGAIVPLKYGKWLPSSGAIGQIGLLIFFVVSAIAVRGATRLPRPRDRRLHAVVRRVHRDRADPAVLVRRDRVAVERGRGDGRPRRDIPIAIARAGVRSIADVRGADPRRVVGHADRAAVVAARPDRRDEDRLHRLRRLDRQRRLGHADRRRAVFGALGAFVFIWVLFASGTAWIMGAGRAQAAACLDGAGPAVLGRVSERTGVPVVMGLVSGAVSMITMVAYLLGHRRRRPEVLLGRTHRRGGDDRARLPDDLPGVRRAADQAARPRAPVPCARRDRVSRGWCRSCRRRGRCWPAICLLWPGFGTSDPDASLPAGFEGDRATFELLVLIPVAADVADLRRSLRVGQVAGAGGGRRDCD